METIFALSTAPGRAGIAVVRLSGPHAWTAAGALTGRPLPEAGRLVARRFVDGSGALLDAGMLCLFREGSGYTGEWAAELHLHGSGAVVAAVLEVLARQPGLRPAVPGEFTRRAVAAGRLDLAQAEGLGDLLMAETEAQRRQALRVMDGALSVRCAAWRAALISAWAMLEVTIDFVDEEVPDAPGPGLDTALAHVIGDIRAELAGADAAERVRTGFEIAILGRPNAGKSSLLNRFAGRDVALTSPVPGTTRDVIELRMDIAGQAVTLLDTAGLRETEDPVERAGVDRARSRGAAADLRLILIAPGDGPIEEVQAGDILVRTKADLGDTDGDGIAVSVLTGVGLDQLRAAISSALADRVAGASLVIRLRHRLALECALEALIRARAGSSPEVIAEDLRLATRALDSLIGRVDVEDVLDHIFASFCLGK